MAIGHIAAFSKMVYNYDFRVSLYNPFAGFQGEPATSRLARIAAEGALPITALGPFSAAMGPQRATGLLDLVAEASAADGGIVAERPERLSLVYRAAETLYNLAPALTLDYAAGHIAPTLEPATTRDGSRLGAQPVEAGGAGVYDEEVTLNVGSDAQLGDIAGWRAHLGTWDAVVFPAIRVLLHQHPSLIPAVTRLQAGDKVRIVGLPIWAGGGEPIDIIVRQIVHAPMPHTWEVTLSGVPAGPWTVGVTGDAEARADTAGVP
ncbi:hypothetical protein ACZ91_66685, partial [Streptomyces regensis]